STETVIAPESITTLLVLATMRHPCEDSAVRSPPAEYDQGLWRYQLLSPLRSADAETWGRPIPPAPALATEFELRVRKLQLTPEMYISSVELRIWCEHNRNRLYIPEWLLGEWGITVDSTFSGVA